MNPHCSTQKHTRKKTFFQSLVIAFTAFSLLFSQNMLQAQDVLMGLTSNGGPEGKGTAYSIKTDTKAFNVIKSFVDWGSNPESELVRGTDGYLYGMTPNGGTFDGGTLFKISTSGDITILKHFNYYAEGSAPHGSLIQATDGNFYGMLTSSSTYTGGAIFKMTPGGQFSIIKNLNLNTEGGRPNGRLLQASDGSFYGITTSGGTFGYGTIFKLTTGGQYTALKAFNGTTEGGNSYGSLMQASDGALYGMTRYGGNFKGGVIFRIETGGAFKVLKHLSSATDASEPRGNLVQGKDGWLYGMSPSGSAYNGVIFKINMAGTSFVLLHKINASVDGGNPHGSLVLGKDGFFYGMTSIAGGSSYAGTVFKIGSGGGLSVVKRFTEATEGGWAYGSLIQAPDGAFYGMTSSGGKNLKGTIFKLVGSTLTVLSHLNGINQGSEPVGNLVIGKDSAYFGVTKTGGAYNYGTLFKTCGGVTTILRSFNRSTDGGTPVGGLLRAKDGNLYGMAETGGLNSSGTIFRFSPATGTFSVIRHLKSATDGGEPQGTLVQGADSYLYGVTYSGGPNASGTIFKIHPSGTPFSLIRSLVYATDGNRMLGGLVIGTDGYFYGMTSNSTRFFKFKTAADFTIVKTIAYSTDGGTPYGNLVLGTDGAFYGTMSSGGTYYGGIIFKITTGGTITKLKHLNPTTDGGTPRGSLVRGTDSAFYGTTSTGGTGKAGTIFRIKGTSFSVLRHFKMETDGGTPLGGLIVAPKITLVANAQSGLTTTEDVAKAITLSGSGGANLTYNILIKPRRGTVSTGTAAARTYTPAANFYGVDSFAFTTNLGCLSSAPAWIKINVAPVNDTPKLASFNTQTVVKGTQLKFLATAVDPDPGQTKTFSLVGAPAGATIGASTGLVTWTPSVTGTFTFKVRVTDNGSPILYSEQTVTVNVTAAALTSLSAADVTAKQSEVETKALSAFLYPNPAHQRVTVTLPYAVTAATVTIMDAKGMIVRPAIQNTGGTQFQVEATTLKPGVYLLHLKMETGNQTLKFVKL